MDEVAGLVLYVIIYILYGLFHAACVIVTAILLHFEYNQKSRKIVKGMIYGLCLLPCMTLLSLSYIHNKLEYAMLGAIFICVNIFILIIDTINKQYFKNNKKVKMLNLVLTKLSIIAFYIFVFVFLNTLNSVSAKAVLITISSIDLAFIICIDIFRIFHYGWHKVRKTKTPNDTIELGK